MQAGRTQRARRPIYELPPTAKVEEAHGDVRSLCGSQSISQGIIKAISDVVEDTSQGLRLVRG